MLVKNDDTEVKLSLGFIQAIKKMLREEILMMRKVYPDSKECWVIGVAEIDDLSNSAGIVRMFGGKDDKVWLKKEGRIFVEVPL
jgi:hypothetical protein